VKVGQHVDIQAACQVHGKIHIAMHAGMLNGAEGRGEREREEGRGREGGRDRGRAKEREEKERGRGREKSELSTSMANS
jgi:hypothetical protein